MSKYLVKVGNVVTLSVNNYKNAYEIYRYIVSMENNIRGNPSYIALIDNETGEIIDDNMDD